MLRSLKHSIAVVATVCAVSILPWAAADATTTLRLLWPWHPGTPVDDSLAFLDKQLAEDGGEVVIRRFGPEVVPPFEQLEPVSSGAFDLHYTNGGYHAGATQIGQLASTLVADPEKIRKSGIWDWIDKYYQENHNLKVLAIIPSIGFQFVLREPIKQGEALAGRKIRSIPIYEQMIKTLGGAPVQTPFPQVYTALQKGLVDGTGWPLHSMMTHRLYEVVHYMARPTWGGSTHFLLANLDRWNNLSPSAQEDLLDAGRRLESHVPEHFRKVFEEDQKAMMEHGVKLTQFAPAQAKQLDELFSKGLRERAHPETNPQVREFLDLIDEKGMDSGAQP